MVMPGAFFSWSTLLHSGWSGRWCRLCTGAACQPWRLLEEFPLLRCLPCRVVRTWKSGLCFRPRIFQSFWCLGVACGVSRIFGTRALLGSTVGTFSTGGFGRISHFFYVAVNSNPEAFALHSCRMEKCAQSLLLQRGSHVGS